MELKGIDKLNKFFNKWLADHNFDAVVEFGTDFCVHLDSNTIEYSFTIPQDHDVKFFQLCQSMYPDLVACDNFILSFFHELGHIETEDYWTNKEWENYYDFTENPRGASIDSYYNYPIELEATKWGCEYILSHVDEIEEFVKNYVPLVMEFYSINQVELE